MVMRSGWNLRAGIPFLGLALIVLTGQGAAPNEVRLGFFPNITHGQALYAKATDYFQTSLKVPIKWTSFNAGPTAIEALFADAIDATYIGPSPAINGYLRSHGEKFVIVAGAASGGAALVVRKDVLIRSEKDFTGKIIATPQLGNTQDIAARGWFAEHGYRFKAQGGSLAIIPLSNADQLTMFKKKEIDGAWTVEPWVSRLEIEGGGRVFLEEKDLWPEGRYVTTHLVVSRSFLASHTETAKALLAAHIEVTQIINSNKPAALKILNTQLKKETGRALKTEVIESALKRVEFTWDPITASLEQSAAAAHRIHFIRTVPDLRGIYQLQMLNQILRDKGLNPVEEKKKDDQPISK